MKAELIVCNRYRDTISKCAQFISENLQVLDKITVFCEDKYTLSMERALAKSLKSGGSLDIRVTSFSRYLQRRIKGKPLSKEGAIMAVASIIIDSDRELKYLKGGFAKNTAAAVYELIAQLKSSKILPSDLLLYAAEGLLKGKIDDIYLIYKKYEEFLSQGYIDENGYLQLLPSLIELDGDIKFGTVIFAGFSSFTMQGAAVLESALNFAQSVVGIFCGGQSEIYTNEAAQVFERVCASVGITPKFSLDQSSIGDEQFAICKLLFEPQVFKSQSAVESQNIFLYEAQTPDDEAQYACQRIDFEVKANGRRYKDIAVICENDRLEQLKRALELSNIPYFSDAKKAVIEHPLSGLILSYVKMHESGFSVEDCLKFIKNIYFESRRDLTDGFESYAVKYGLRRIILNAPLTYEDESTGDYNNLLERAAALCTLKKTMTAGGFVSGIKDMLKSLQVEKTTESLTNQTADFLHLSVFNSDIEDKIYGLLDEIKNIMGAARLSVRDFYQILHSGLSAKTVSLIPAYSDAVYIGDYFFAGISPKVLFCLGLNQSVPGQSADTAFLNDRDIERLNSFKLKIEPRIQTVNRRARECAGIILASFDERLYASYSSFKDGAAQRKSEIVLYLQKIFTRGGVCLMPLSKMYLENLSNLEHSLYHVYRFSETGAGALNFLSDISAYRDGDKPSAAAAAAFYRAVDTQTQSLLKKALDGAKTDLIMQIDAGRQIFMNKDELSVSLIQSFYQCPYRNFLSNGLKLKELCAADATPIDAGNLLHAVMESALSQGLLESEGDYAHFCENRLDELVEKYPVKHIKQRAEIKVWLNRLADEAARILFAMRSHSGMTKFKAANTEAGFGGGGEYPKLELKGTNGRSLHGIIDRVDEYGGAVRVIDYKSGSIDSKDLRENYYFGCKIQLWIYLNAVRAGKIPAGGYYFDLNDKYTAEGQAEKNYKMTGITSGSEDILQATDSGLTSESAAATVNVRKGKKGYLGDILPPDEFENYINYSLKVAAAAANYLECGLISPSPYSGSCKYCEFGGICGFDISNGQERAAQKISEADIASAVKLCGEGGND